MFVGDSRTAGKLIRKGPEAQSECGIWICTPRTLDCHVTRNEFCHFLEGRATYVHAGSTMAASTRAGHRHCNRDGLPQPLPPWSLDLYRRSCRSA
ncbi:MAG: cupin domain-containing protein [Pseudomonadota bacterium]